MEKISNNTEDMKVIQDKILEIVLYLDVFCKKHNITYYLMGGSALGAVRHEGFIPWDDDLDVFMTYPNYVKFIRACESDLDLEKFYLQKENTEEWPLFFSKLRMNNTTFIESDTQYRKMHKGFYVDIMCLNNTTKNKFYRFAQYIAARIVISKTLKKRGYFTDNPYKKLLMHLSDFFLTNRIMEKLVWFVRSLNNKETSYVGHFFGRAKFKNTSFPTKYLGKERYIKFSSTKLPVIEKVEEYLAVRYGESFMKMPDQKTKDMYPSHAIYTNTMMDYREYEKLINFENSVN